MTRAGPRLVLPVGPRDHILGAATAPLTLLEYGDYECPFCRTAHSVVRNVRERMGPRLRFVYRHFPLVNVHPRAEPAAEAAEWAVAERRFWDMHDRLFEYQDALGDEELVTHAAALGLGVPRFVREFTRGMHAARVHEDFVSGVRSGVNGTPTFFLNGVRHDGGYDAPSLIAAMEEALESRRTGTA